MKIKWRTDYGTDRQRGLKTLIKAIKPYKRAVTIEKDGDLITIKELAKTI